MDLYLKNKIKNHYLLLWLLAFICCSHLSGVQGLTFVKNSPSQQFTFPSNDNSQQPQGKAASSDSTGIYTQTHSFLL